MDPAIRARRDFIERFATTCSGDDRIAAVFLPGSYAVSTPDRYSDVDLLVVAAEATEARPERAVVAQRLRQGRGGSLDVRAGSSRAHVRFARGLCAGRERFRDLVALFEPLARDLAARHDLSVPAGFARVAKARLEELAPE